MCPGVLSYLPLNYFPLLATLTTCVCFPGSLATVQTPKAYVIQECWKL